MKYESEVSQFLSQLKEERPYLDQQQQMGRSLLWDKQINRDLAKGFKEARVKQKPYVYQPD